MGSFLIVHKLAAILEQSRVTFGCITVGVLKVDGNMSYLLRKMSRVPPIVSKARSFIFTGLGMA